MHMLINAPRGYVRQRQPIDEALSRRLAHARYSPARAPYSCAPFRGRIARRYKATAHSD